MGAPASPGNPGCDRIVTAGLHGCPAGNTARATSRSAATGNAAAVETVAVVYSAQASATHVLAR
jgi:hypothetical protein